MLAVSMKLPPALRKASYTLRASSLAVPQPQSSPKVMVPSAASETRRPLLPKSRYRIESPFFALRIGFVLDAARASRATACRARRRGKDSGGDQKWIRVAFLADAGQTAVPRIADRLVRQLHQLAAKRVRDLVHR